jgi:hypothetical protein
MLALARSIRLAANGPLLPIREAPTSMGSIRGVGIIMAILREMASGAGSIKHSIQSLVSRGLLQGKVIELPSRPKSGFWTYFAIEMTVSGLPKLLERRL